MNNQVKLTPVILLLFLVTKVFFVVAQDSEIEDIPELINNHIIETGKLNSVNLAFIHQVGDNNMIQSQQYQEGAVSNYFILNQNGFGNNGYINQEGAGHITQMQQTGLNNEANSWSLGEATLSLINQEGNDNKINSYIDNQGFLPKSVALEQNGNHNSIDIALLGNGFWNESFPKAAHVNQNGNNLEFNAVLDSYHSPILVEQQSGSSGGGMTVTISNSAFNFPMK